MTARHVTRVEVKAAHSSFGYIDQTSNSIHYMYMYVNKLKYNKIYILCCPAGHLRLIYEDQVRSAIISVAVNFRIFLAKKIECMYCAQSKDLSTADHRYSLYFILNILFFGVKMIAFFRIYFKAFLIFFL